MASGDARFVDGDVDSRMWGATVRFPVLSTQLRCFSSIISDSRRSVRQNCSAVSADDVLVYACVSIAVHSNYKILRTY